ncbi:MAG: transposase [Treponema sp.]|jgi:REP element-mobilizing transposase RayT|nr:transposase [Treponema sp.]
MARKNRGDTSHSDTYHVTSEINRRAMELQSLHTKTIFMQVITEAHQKYAFKKLWNFCIMDNHIHFLITPGKTLVFP